MSIKSEGFSASEGMFPNSLQGVSETSRQPLLFKARINSAFKPSRIKEASLMCARL